MKLYFAVGKRDSNESPANLRAGMTNVLLSYAFHAQQAPAFSFWLNERTNERTNERA